MAANIADTLGDWYILRARAQAQAAAGREFPKSELRVNAEGPRDALAQASEPEWWWDRDMRDRWQATRVNANTDTYTCTWCGHELGTGHGEGCV